MALSNPTVSNITATTADCAVDTDVGTGTIYFLVSAAASARIEPSAVVNFGQSVAGPFTPGTISLGTWTGLYPTADSTDNIFKSNYWLHVVQDALDDGNLSAKVTSAFFTTLNDDAMEPPASTVRYIEYDRDSIDRDDPLIQEWLASGGNVISDNHTSVLSQAVTEGSYTITFTNPDDTPTTQDRVLTIRKARPKSSSKFTLTNVAKADYSSDLDDVSEFWGLYKHGDYLFCAKGGSTLSTDQCGVRVFDVSDPANPSLEFSDFPRDSSGAGFVGLNHFVRTIKVKGTPGTTGAEMYVIFRSSPYTADDQASAIYKYDISNASPASWALATWATGHQHLGGSGSPAYSVPLMSDMDYDGTKIYVSSQKNGLRVYAPADLSSLDGQNNDYTPKPHESQGLCVDSSASGYVYMATYINGLRIIDKATLSDGKYRIIGQQEAPDGTLVRPWDCCLSVDENWLFMSLQSGASEGEATVSGLQVVDVHNPEKPQIVAQHILPESKQDVFNGRHDPACVRISQFTHNTREYVVLGNLKKGPLIYDVTDPTRPVFMNNHPENLDTLGTEPDGVGMACVWQDGGKSYIAYGDYGSDLGAAGTKQLYIDELTIGGEMSVAIGNTAAPTGTGGYYIAGTTNPVRGVNTAYDYTAVAGDYVDTLRIAVYDPPAARTIAVGIYRTDTGALVHEEEVTITFPDYSVNPIEVVYIPLANRVYLTAGVEHTIRLQHRSGGTNMEIQDYNAVSSLESPQYTPSTSGAFDAALPAETNYARDGIVALIGGNINDGGTGGDKVTSSITGKIAG